jgi:hypothetical protein
MPTPSFDSVGKAQDSNVGSITSAAFTIGGSDRVCMVDVLLDFDRVVSTVTVGGVSGVFVDKQLVGGASQFEIIETWRVVAPPIGSQTAVATFDANNPGACAIIATNYKDVRQTTPLGTPAKTSGSSTAASIEVASAVGELVHAQIWHRNGNAGYTVTGGQTDRETNVISAAAIQAASDEAGAAVVILSTSHTNSAGWCAVGVSLKPAPGLPYQPWSQRAPVLAQ